MKLIAKRPCSFGGKKFFVGDEIPAEFVLDPKAHEQMGTLVIVADPVEEAAPTMEVVIRANEGDLPLNLTQEGLQAVVDVLTGNADDAKPIVDAMTDGDALILLHCVDNRKAVKTAAEERAKALNAEERAPEETEEPENPEEPEEPEESAGDQ